MKTVTVVGASLAGLYAARALREQGFDGRLVVIGDEPHRPYDRPPLSKDFLAGKIEADVLALEGPDDSLEADWRLGSVATALDRTAREVVLAGGERIASDGVVVATGARARSLAESGDLAGVHVLRTLDDAHALKVELVPGARLVVIGAGFIGGEVASTAKALGLDVTVVEAMPTPLAGPLGVEMGAVVSGLHEDHGVRLRCGVGVRSLVGRGNVEGVELADGTLLPADVVVVGIGATPNTEWLAQSGVQLGNGVECDRQGRTSLPGVVAVGDCASWHEPRLGRPHRVEHWTGAMERPAVAVASLLRGPDSGSSPTDGGDSKIPYFWSDQYDVRIQFAGHAAQADSVTIEEGSAESRSLLAVYRRGDVPVAALAMNQARLFGRWRRQLNAAASA
ncbi:FAD-dependent oxidoreductase [Micromonospora sp. KC606]|uniref:NAD(P)/FAD-dependent oxidoreductase n=1 Tax=Micromonospora sp. KC606 TaxID=2530379 RepID=UPI001045A73D|nr:FAD-dependent oxidoreductase [Micromonospora sp. KC606]TDC85783.1 FAD-dependent oxidoreductase [Micromonospora sp. KC606]